MSCSHGATAVTTKVLLPDHWEITSECHFDDGRDYDKPQYERKDKLARVYHNEGENGTQYEFAIVYDGDGDCCGSLEEALRIADMRVEKHGLKR